MEDQITIRLSDALARQLNRRARAAGVKRSQIVREALTAFLGIDVPATPSQTVRERSAPYLGAVRLTRASADRDDLARRLRAHNWRP